MASMGSELIITANVSNPGDIQEFNILSEGPLLETCNTCLLPS